MKRLCICCAAVLLLLCACAQPGEVPADTTVPDTAAPAVASSAAPETEAPTAPPTTVPDTAEETEPLLLYRNPLNGQPLAEPYTGRPVAIMLNNIQAAMPMYGNSRADILYEVLTEGGITRCLGIYSDISGIPQIGSVRSARKYFVELAQGYDALYIHFGGATEALNYLKTITLDELDGMKSGSYVFQDKARVKAGYASEHTWFVAGDTVLQYMQDKGIARTVEADRDYGLTFGDQVSLEGQEAETVTVWFNQGSRPSSSTKYTRFTYSADTGLYTASQYGADFLDAATGEALQFRNVLALRCSNSLQADGYRMTIATTGSGSGFFACNGEIVPILWSRSSVLEPYQFTLEDGTPITLGVGSTYIALIPLRGQVDY